jgi:outer membrane protein assembly factor BamD
MLDHVVPEDKTANWSPNRIYAEAKDELNSGSYDKATRCWKSSKAAQPVRLWPSRRNSTRPMPTTVPMSRPRRWRRIDRFMKLHPASPAIDYALYLKGIINFNDDLGMFSFLTRQDLSERDQKAAKESFEAFKELAARFPRITLHAGCAAAHDLHRQLAGAVRSACGTLLLPARRLPGRHQPGPDRAGGLPRRAGAGRSPVHHGASYEALGMTQLRKTPGVCWKPTIRTALFTKGFKRDDEPWWKFW